jgi:rhamnulokinase/L-fuculokinase
MREGTKYGFGELVEMGKAAKPLQSFINPDDPRFGVPGNIPKKIREYCAETNQPIPETVGDIVRCISQSLAMRYRWTVEKIDEMVGERMPAINIVGGGTQDKLLSQLSANACGRPVFTGPVEATALGNIAAQAIANGEIKDLKEAREVIANSFEIEEYYPENNAAEWDEAYETFKKLI